MTRPPLPIGIHKEKLFIDTRYSWFAKKHGNKVAEMFDNNVNQTNFDGFTWNGQKLRRELHSLQMFWQDFEKIADEYKCIITNAQIYRLYSTNKGSDRDKGYSDVVDEMKNCHNILIREMQVTTQSKFELSFADRSVLIRIQLCRRQRDL